MQVLFKIQFNLHSAMCLSVVISLGVGNTEQSKHVRM